MHIAACKRIYPREDTMGYTQVVSASFYQDVDYRELGKFHFKTELKLKIELVLLVLAICFLAFILFIMFMEFKAVQARRRQRREQLKRFH